MPRLDGGDFAATNLALHGLWPNGADGDHPFYCGVSQADRDADEAGDWCALPDDRHGSGDAIRSGAGDAGQRVLPGPHEWTKHRHLPGLGGDAYFDAAAQLVRRDAGDATSKAPARQYRQARSPAATCSTPSRQDFGAGAADGAGARPAARTAAAPIWPKIRLALRPDADRQALVRQRAFPGRIRRPHGAVRRTFSSIRRDNAAPAMLAPRRPLG